MGGGFQPFPLDELATPALKILVLGFGDVLFSPLVRRSPALWLLVPAALVGAGLALGVGGLADAYGRFQEGFVNPQYGIP